MLLWRWLSAFDLQAPPEGRKLLIVGTTSTGAVMEVHLPGTSVPLVAAFVDVNLPR